MMRAMQLVNNVNPSDRDLFICGFSFQSVLNKQLRGKIGEQNLPSLEVLLTKSIETDKPYISKQMALKIAESGLQLKHLKLCFNRDGVNGLHNLLAEEFVPGCPRVTKVKKHAEGIAMYFNHLL